MSWQSAPFGRAQARLVLCWTDPRRRWRSACRLWVFRVSEALRGGVSVPRQEVTHLSSIRNGCNGGEVWVLEGEECARWSGVGMMRADRWGPTAGCRRDVQESRVHELSKMVGGRAEGVSGGSTATLKSRPSSHAGQTQGSKSRMRWRSWSHESSVSSDVSGV